MAQFSTNGLGNSQWHVSIQGPLIEHLGASASTRKFRVASGRMMESICDSKPPHNIITFSKRMGYTDGSLNRTEGRRSTCSRIIDRH